MMCPSDSHEPFISKQASTVIQRLDALIQRRDDAIDPPAEEAVAAIRPVILFHPENKATEHPPVLFAYPFETATTISYRVLSVGDMNDSTKPLYFGSRTIHYIPSPAPPEEWAYSFTVDWVPWNTTYRAPGRDDAGKDKWSYSSETYRKTATGIELGEHPMLFLQNWEMEPPLPYQQLADMPGHWWYHPEAFPATPVAQGDRWSLPIPSDRSRGYQYEVIGYATVDDEETIVVRRIWTLHHPRLAFRWTWDDTLYVSIADHSPIYAEYTIFLNNSVRTMHVHQYQYRVKLCHDVSN